MIPEKAKLIYEALAAGVDPQSGEELEADSPFNQAETIRAMFYAKELAEAEVKRTARKARRAKATARGGAKWTESEDTHLRSAFQEGASVAQLAKIHKRSTLAIESRLQKLELSGRDEHGLPG